MTGPEKYAPPDRRRQNIMLLEVGDGGRQSFLRGGKSIGNVPGNSDRRRGPRSRGVFIDT